VLDTKKLRTTFRLTLPDWRQSLALCLEELAPSARGQEGPRA